MGLQQLSSETYKVIDKCIFDYNYYKRNIFDYIDYMQLCKNIFNFSFAL